MNPSDGGMSYSGEGRSNADDVALIKRMVDADETALGALYDEWSRSLYSLVLHLLKDADEAEDVVEETFWQAWRKASAYEPSRGAVSTWLLTIGRRKALDRLRARKRHREDPIGGERTISNMLAPDQDPSADAEVAEIREHVRSAVRDLPKEQREVLEMGYFSGLSQSEISRITGEPLGTIKTRMRLAMQKLKEPLAAHRKVTE
jgi:RNA polymerase sigma-70 factor (ECF subfamily)